MSGLHVHRDDGVVTLVLDRPGTMNSLNAELLHALEAELALVGERSGDRVLVLTGAGGNFSSGADLTSLGSGHPLPGMEMTSRVALALSRVEVPTIARVEGVAVGAALNFALTCDLVVVTEDARLAEIFPRRGLSVDGGGSWLLPRLVGWRKATELCFFGDTVKGAEAVELGLVNRCVPASELDAAVQEWVDRLLVAPTRALGLSKRLLREASTSSFEQALDNEGRAQVINLLAEDAKEALAAFKEKRPAVFRGR